MTFSAPLSETGFSNSTCSQEGICGPAPHQRLWGLLSTTCQGWCPWSACTDLADSRTKTAPGGGEPAPAAGAAYFEPSVSISSTRFDPV